MRGKMTILLFVENDIYKGIYRQSSNLQTKYNKAKTYDKYLIEHNLR